MNQEHHPQLDGVEAALLELSAAEQAGVMRRTVVNAGELLRPGAPAPLRRLVARLVPIAAAVAIAVTGGLWMVQTGSDAVRQPTGIVAGDSDSQGSPCDGNFLNCFGGPRAVVATGCRAHDYDADGDVDLADFSAFQLACDKPVVTQ